MLGLAGLTSLWWNGWVQLEVTTIDQRGAPLGQISSVVERMNEAMAAHHRLFVRIVLSSVASSQG